jgi:formylglycine-generating enzyme required for sulfatase activity
METVPAQQRHQPKGRRTKFLVWVLLTGVFAGASVLAIVAVRKRGSQMVRVPAGAVSIGADDGEPDERPMHEVQVGAFEIDRTEVTVAAYGACVAAGACAPPETFHERCNTHERGKDQHPLNCVTWARASAYCAWAGKRLPSEEEWEYAARGAQGGKYPWGDAPPQSRACWNKPKTDGTCVSGTHPEDRSPLGVLDMGASVSEWTSTLYCPYPGVRAASPTSASGATGVKCKEGARVTRGGSWDMTDPSLLRSTYRDWVLEKDRGFNLGFRCARSVP